MKLLLALLLSLPLAAQVTAVKGQTTVTGTTGTMVCTATSVLPSVTLKCVNGSDSFQSSGPLSPGTVAQTITINSTGGAQTWQFTLPTAAGPVAYAVTATPTAGCLSGAVCTGQGTF